MPKKKETRKKLSPFLKECQELFHTTNLYEVLSIRKGATSQEVKKGYHKKSLAVHPDRVEAAEKDVATKKFQTLGKVYTILSDDNKRSVYNETGDVGEEDSVIDQDRDWCEYWRLLFPKITVQKIEEFEKKYKGSAEELADLKTAYMEAEGDMDIIMDSVMCSVGEDEERFRQILDDLIKDGELPEFKTFTMEPKKKKLSRQKKMASEAEEAAVEAKKLKLDDTDSSLTALIEKRNSSRAVQAESFFANLEAKYAQPQKGKKKKK